MYRVGGNSYPNTLHAVTKLFKMVPLNNRIILVPILNCGTYELSPHWACLLCVKASAAPRGRGCQMVQVIEQRVPFTIWRGPRYFQIKDTVYSIESRYFHPACWKEWESSWLGDSLLAKVNPPERSTKSLDEPGDNHQPSQGDKWGSQ